jgi:hypothetical protein
MAVLAAGGRAAIAALVGDLQPLEDGLTVDLFVVLGKGGL